MRLTGKERWILDGDTMGRMWGDKDCWWPIVFVELDTSLLKIDVIGKQQNCHLDDFAELKLGSGEIIKHEDFSLDPYENSPIQEP